VRYADGVVQLDTADLSSDGFGTPWGVTRFWTNAAGDASRPLDLAGGMIAELPLLVPFNIRAPSPGNPLSGPTSMALVSSGVTTRYFDQQQDGSYKAEFYWPEKLSQDPSTGDWLLSDSSGAVLRFVGFGTSAALRKQYGQLRSYTDAAGNVTGVTAWAADGEPAEVQRSASVGGVSTVESYLYSYAGATSGDALLTGVLLRRQVGSGVWQSVRQVAYSYYGAAGANGTQNDLKTAVVSDAAGNVLSTSYYRYYTVGDLNGYMHGLK
jgi:hypothetical protein